MGFTYRQGKEGRLSIEEMDNNILYTEEQISSLTASISTLNTNLATATASIVALEEQLTGLTSSNGPAGPTGPTGPAGFGTTGAISFPFLPGNARTGSGDNLQFEKGSVYQKIISTQDGTESVPNVERLVICGGDSYQNGPTYSGEGGDVYLYGGKGQNGGDIKVDAGNGISEGGTVKVRGGYTETGAGGFVEITAGDSSDGDGGDVEITAGTGYGNGNDGGSVLITSGYGANTGGNITLDAANGGTAGGNVIVRTEGGNERMRITADGKIEIGTTTPALSLNVVLSGDLNINTTRSGIQSTSKITTIGDWQDQDKGNKINIDDSADFAFYTNLATNGKFGINTTNPSVALDVVGDVNITGVITSTSSMILKPDSSLDTDQYIILDPTEGGPNHIHIRAGGPIDDSSADLFIGGEDNNLRVSDTTKTVQINSKNLYTQDSASFSVGPNYDSATWSDNLITITNPNGDLINFINAYQIETDIFTVFYDPITGASLNITNKDTSNYPTHILTVDQTSPTASLAITGIDIEIIRYQSGRVIADNGTVTIQTGDTDAPENWVFGTNGSITFPDDTVQTTAYTGSDLGYLMWFGNISQTGTNNPTVNELGSTLGYGLSWTRGGTGSYYAEVIGAPVGWLQPVWCTTPSESVKNSNFSLRQKVIIKYDDFNNRLVLTTMNDSGVLADDLLLDQPVEIRKIFAA
jgi:hypothetical protein